MKTARIIESPRGRYISMTMERFIEENKKGKISNEKKYNFDNCFYNVTITHKSLWSLDNAKTICEF